MSTVIEEFVAKLGWDVDSKQLKTFNDQARGLKDFALTGARYVRNFAAGLVAFTTATALAHTRITKLAASSGFTAETLEALDNALSGTGKSVDAVAKSSVRLQSILGKMRTGSASKEMANGFRAIGLAAKDFEGKAPEEVFSRVSDAVIKATDSQKAMSASAALLGEEASVILGHYRSLGKSVSDIVSEYRVMTYVDDQSRAGTQAFSEALLRTKDTLLGVARYIAGITGSVFSPYLKTLNEWIVLNKELVKSKIKDFVRGVASALKWLLSLAGQIKDLIHSVGGLGNSFKLFFGILLGVKLVPFLVSLNKILKAAGSLGPALSMADKGLLKSWGPIGALFSLIYLLVDDILVSLRGGKSLGGWIDDTFQISKWLHDLPTLLGVPADRLDELYQKLQDISPIFRYGLAQGFQTLLGLGWETVMDFVDRVGDGIRQVFGMLVDTIKGVFDSILNATGLGSVIKMLSGAGGKKASEVAGAAAELTPLGPAGKVVAQMPGAGETLMNTLPGMMIPEMLSGKKMDEMYSWIDKISGPTSKLVQQGPLGQIYSSVTVNASTDASPQRIASEARRETERALKRARRNY